MNASTFFLTSEIIWLKQNERSNFDEWKNNYMKYEFDSNDLLDDLELKGPALGFSFYF